MADEWRPMWETAKRAIPAATTIGESESRAVCEQALGQLRESWREILPSPNDDVDRLVEVWLRQAEDIMYECPTRSGEHAGFAAAYDELNRLETEIAVALGGRAAPFSLMDTG